MIGIMRVEACSVKQTPSRWHFLSAEHQMDAADCETMFAKPVLQAHRGNPMTSIGLS